MNINNSISFLSNNENGTVTLFAVPVHLIQQSSPQPQSLIVEENVLFKTLPDGSIVLDTNQLLNSNSNSALNTTDVINNRKSFDNNELILTLQQNDGNILINQPHEINTSNEIKSKIDNNKNNPKIRYLNKKSIEVRKVGRPRKDVSKLNNNEIDKKGPFTCKFCKKEFEKWLLYKRHEKSHINEKKYKCSSCPASFNILSNHILHLATHNTDDPTCPECGKKFHRIASLKAHLMHHEKEENFYCEECDFLFDNEVEMNEHLKVHGQEKKDELESLKCRYCQLLFDNQAEFKKHMSEHNKMRSILQTPAKKKTRRTGIIERKHQCNVCSKAFQKRSQIERHMRVHSGEKPFICNVCNRGFSQNGSLQIHMSRHTGVKPHKCTLCQAKFSQKGNLRAHILKTHSISSGEGNVYCCTECSCVFKRLGSLNGHMTRNHPKDKSNDIKFVLSQLSAMQNNMNVDNNSTSLLNTTINTNSKCDVQNIEATQFNAPSATYVTLAGLGLDGTMRRYVIKQRKVGDIRWHLCSYCPKEFKKPSDLVRHLRVHTREKPYSCKYCNRAFAIKSTLTTHLKTHTKCTTVECKYCHKFFSSWNSLNAHILKHTGSKQKCNICNKVCRSKSQLVQHVKSHVVNETSYHKQPNSNNIMLEPIQITSRGLEPVSSLRKRPMIEAGCKTRPYTCKICGGGYRKLSHLKQHHVLKHTRERPYSCSHCFRNFGSSSILKSHLSTHNGARPYQCPVCRKTFSTKGSLKRHMVAHSSTKPFICPYCFLDFKTLVQCKKHIGTHITNDINMEIDDTCDIGENELVDIESTELTNNINDHFTILSPIIIEPKITNETENIKTDPKNNITVTVNVDENRTHLTQDLDDNLNSQMLSIIGSENFIDTSTYINKIDISQPIATTDELVNTLTGANELPEKQIEDNSFLYQQVIVNLNPELPMFDANGIDNIVSNLKLQNDSLFLTDLNSLNMNESNNVLLPFQINAQPEIPQNQLIMLPPELEQDIQSAATPVTLESIDPNLQLKINNMNRYILNPAQNDMPLAQIQTPETSEFLNVEEHVIPTFIRKPIDIDSNILTDVVLTNEKAKTNITDSLIGTTVTDETTCNMCKIQFKTKNDLKVHQCINLLSIEIDESNPITNEETATNEVVTIGKDKNLTEKEFLEYVTKKVQSVKANSDTCNNTVKHRNQCSFCPKSFRKPSDLQRHLRTHTGERPYKCDECEKSFSLKSTLESHSKIHQGKKEFTCLVCNCSLSSKGSLNLHMRLHTGVKPYKCPLCPLRFRTTGHLKAHLTVHYKEVLKTGKISTDGMARKTKMAEFVKKVENIITANINSEQNQNFKDDDNQCEIDLQLHETIRLDPCIENSINLQAEDKQPLNMHFEIETNTEGQIVNIKPTASNILFIDETSKKEVASTQVEFDEKTKLQIEDFLRDKKDKQMENKNRLKKICSVCKKEFGTKYLLDRHSKIHTGEKLFSCNFCTKAFNQKNALQIHTRTHFGSRPYSCPHCSNNFSQIGNLKTHVKRIHNGLNVEQPTATISSIDNTDINR